MLATIIFLAQDKVMDVSLFTSEILNTRIEVALVTLILSIVGGVVFGLVLRLLKQSTPAMPPFEMVFRPVAVFLIDRLNRQNRSALSLMIRGMIVFFAMIGIIFSALSGFRFAVPFAYGDHVLLFVLLSPILPIFLSMNAAQKKPIEDTYRHVAQSINRNLIKLDQHGHCRNAVELLALSLSQWVFAPLMFYMVGGIGGAYGYAVLSVFCRVAGESGETKAFTSVFGFAYCVLQAMVNIVASVIVIIASLFIPKGNPLRSARGVKNGMLAVFACALNTTLGGAYQDRHGQAVERKWVGADQSSAKLVKQDVYKGAYLYGVSVFLTVSVLVLILIAL